MRLLGVFGALLSLSILACGPAEDAVTSSDDAGVDEAMLGRWDASVTGDDPYPLWFELGLDGDALNGRLQPRGGHALAFDSVSATGETLSMSVGGTRYEATFDGKSFSGTGERDGNQFSWVAVRAPELPAPDAPKWGEPVELFDGVTLSGWRPFGSDDNQWAAEDGVLVNAASGANLMTEGEYQNFKLHIEVNVPEGSNSGIYLRGRHEVQVQDDHGKEPHSRHMGGIYGQITPTSNPSLPAGEWQSFDITLLGRWVSVVLNGETIIDHQEIPGITGGALDSNEAEPGPIYLQGDHGRVLYRNIVLTPAE